MTADGQEVDQDLVDSATQLPDAVVGGVSVAAATAFEPNGVAHPVVILSMLFKVEEKGMVGIQHFVLDKDTAGLLRKQLKNPPTQEQEGQ
jgi:hypothetical protein